MQLSVVQSLIECILPKMIRVEPELIFWCQYSKCILPNLIGGTYTKFMIPAISAFYPIWLSWNQNKFCATSNKCILPNTGFVQVLEILESPWISKNCFPGLESPGILMQVLESPGKLNWALSFLKINALKFVTGQFTPKMKANAEPRLLSSLVWIDSGVKFQYGNS